ncbi:TRAP transporter large permease [Chelativorans sp. SCAU2101]|uniref:TRAP transporter large permease n=1 Tax=Chelativorans petroleitrophicus TaxID=2975484 RepID=A0A9X2XA22_9HYPH|nr:TRAP transporter large permease [Chelativorans petroleitrophicus]MCT8991488.1 TRAP transporter large permease [Chelativorans petroleitrophicus]
MWWLTLLVMFSAMLAMFASGLPLFACFMIRNVVAVIYFVGPNGLGLFVNSMLDTTTVEAFVAVPMFILLGELMFRTGGVSLLFKAFDTLIGVIRGRLYFIAVVVAAFIGAISGSTMASVSVLGRFVYPTMVERGCDRRLAVGTILAGATLDAIIPPSVVAIILATLANLSIQKFLLAGIGPGLLLAGCYMAYALVRVLINPKLDSHGGAAVEDTPMDARARFKTILPIIPLSGIIFLTLGLVMLGIAQPTEAAAVGVVGAILMSFLFGTFSFKMIGQTLYGAAITTGTVLFIIASSRLFTQLLAYTGATQGLIEFASGLTVDPWLVYLVMMVAVFILCMFIDQLAVMLILVPVYSPIIEQLGFDPLWFWMMLLINLMFGGITPPLGYTMFVFKSAAPDVPMSEIYKAVIPMILVAMVGVVILTFVPEIVTFLPSLAR